MKKVFIFVFGLFITSYLLADEKTFPPTLKGRWSTLDDAHSQVIEIKKEGSEYLITHWSTRSKCSIKNASATFEIRDGIFVLSVIRDMDMPCSSYYRIELEKENDTFKGYAYSDISSKYQKLKLKFD